MPGKILQQHTDDLAQKLSVLCRGEGEGDEEQIPEGMSPKVVEVYKSLGKIMSRYSTGKVPKAFKIIPNLKQWEEVSSRPTHLLASHSLLFFQGIFLLQGLKTQCVQRGILQWQVWLYIL